MEDDFSPTAQSQERFRKLARAREDGEKALLTEMRGMAHQSRNKDWKAIAWLLERLRPGRHRETRRTEVTGAEGGPVAVTSPVIMIPKESDD